MNKVPCKSCTDRDLYCHSSCQAYAEYKYSLSKLQKEKQKDNELAGYRHDKAIRIKKKLK